MRSSPLSILALGCRINAASAERLALESKRRGSSHRDKISIDEHTSRLMDECEALQDAVIASCPNDLTEALIQGALLHYVMDQMIDEDDADQLKRDMRRICRVLGGIVRVLVKQTSFDLSQVGETDLVRFLDLRTLLPQANAETST